MEDIKQRFLSKIELIPFHTCWEWIAAKDKDGYGRIKIDGIMKRAHRVSYALFKGGIPENHVVCHKCDNPSCVNPDHLFVGGHKDNVQDALTKGRRIPVKNPYRVKPKLIDKIIEVSQSGDYSISEIMKMTGASRGTVFRTVSSLKNAK